jgi:GntR family transcriptional regulator
LSAGFFNPFPKYLQVRHILRRRLGRDLTPGDRLPTEHELVQEFGVSRETVREALRGLEEDGLIRRRRGWGTVVIKLPGTGPDERLTGLVDDFTELKLDTEAEVLSKGVELPSPEVVTALSAPPDEPMYRIQRQRLLEGVPLSHHDCYLPVDVGLAVSRLELRKTTVLKEISQTLNAAIHENRQQIDATVADTEMAKVLAVMMFFKSHFRSDRYYYTVQLTQPQRRRHAATAATRGVDGGAGLEAGLDGTVIER